MKKRNILKESFEFNRIISSYEPYRYKDYIIYLERNNNSDYKFGFSIGKKVGNAVTRNKLKRQIKAIVDKKDYQNNFNCIIIVGRGILMRSFKEMEENLLKAFEHLKIYKEENDETKK